MRQITSRHSLQIALGILWLIDGCLQLQPQMFTRNFATQVIAPAAQGQPWFVSNVIHLAIRLFLLNPALFNLSFALIQLCLGALILSKRSRRVGLIASMIWGLVVWALGEGYGGIFGGHTTLLMGAPGAALLYVVIALAVLPSNSPSRNDKSREPAYWLIFIWAASWIGGAIYQLLPGQNSLGSLKSMILGNVSGAPGWLASLDIHIANGINRLGSPTTSMVGRHMSNLQMANMSTRSGSGYWVILVLAGLQFLIGICVLRRGLIRNVALDLGILLTLIFWIVGQSLGGYYTGLATDPSTAPLFILLALGIFGSTHLDNKLAEIWKKIENTIT